MDPLSQALTGAIVSQSIASRKKIAMATACGIIAGMSPDLDVLIRSNSDPLLALEYHRHFTHSLAFIPVGGLIVATFIWLFFYRRKQDWKTIYIFSTAAYATHGLLDTCTSYGTYLLWPFSNERLAWSNISIVDPIYTITLLVFVIIAAWKKSKKVALLGCILGLSYLFYGAYNHHKAETLIQEVAQERGHAVERLFMNTTLGNNIIWRAIYQSGGNYYIHSISTPPFGETQLLEHSKTNTFDIKRDFPNLKIGSQQHIDLQRFSHFSSGFIYKYNENIVGDLRYGSPAHSNNSIWGIYIDPNLPESHVEFIHMSREQANRIKHLSQLYEDVKLAMFEGLEP